MTDDIKVRIQKGSNQIIFFKEKNGVEFIKFKYDVSTLKRQLSAIEGRKAGIQIYQKTKKEIEDFIKNVSVKPFNYQLSVVESLIIRRAMTKEDIAHGMLEWNPDKDKKKLMNLGVFEVLRKKGIIKQLDSRNYILNADLSVEVRLEFCDIIKKRLYDGRRNNN